METQHSIKYILIGIALFLVGAVVHLFADPYFPPFISNTEKSYQAGFNAARTLVENSSIGGFIKTSDDVRIFSGTAIAVQEGQLTLHIESTNPFDDPALADRTVVINASTKVVRLVLKDAEVYQAEVDSYLKIRSTATIFPSAYTQASARAADIGVGNAIHVIASENAKTLKQFVAASIQIKPSAPVR